MKKETNGLHVVSFLKINYFEVFGFMGSKFGSFILISENL